MDDITSFSHRRLATILRNPNHPNHSAAKAEKDRRNMQREGLSSFKNFDEATYTDTGWQKPKKDTMSKSDGMQKAKALAKKKALELAERRAAEIAEQDIRKPHGCAQSRGGVHLTIAQSRIRWPQRLSCNVPDCCLSTG